MDNQGRGEAFSPTDLLSVALATCILTTMGIAARDMGLELAGSTYEVFKEMADAPRRVAAVRVHFQMRTQRPLDGGERERLERIAHACPVARSLAEAVEQDVTFSWQEA